MDSDLQWSLLMLIQTCDRFHKVEPAIGWIYDQVGDVKCAECGGVLDAREMRVRGEIGWTKCRDEEACAGRVDVQDERRRSGLDPEK